MSNTNTVILGGKVKGKTFSNDNMVNFSVQSGKGIYRISLFSFARKALKTIPEEGMNVLVEGSFQPTSKDGKKYYNIQGGKVSFIDAGEVNQIIVCGRLTQDPEVRVSQKTGDPFTYGTIAWNVGYKNKNGDWDNRAHFIDFIARGEGKEFMRKGEAVWLIGSLSVSSYKDKEGNTTYATSVMANSIVPAGTGKSSLKKTEKEATDDGFMPADDDFNPFESETVEKTKSTSVADSSSFDQPDADDEDELDGLFF